jgi:hypothetical protein
MNLTMPPAVAADFSADGSADADRFDLADGKIASLAIR